ncbi:hypothetical protein HN51_057518 [Arachis hypogaea]
MIQLEQQIKDNNDDDELCHLGDVVGENGIIKVASEFLREVRVLKDGDNLMKRKELGKLLVAGSPRLRVYETDFGWGNPKKSEGFVDVECSESITLSDSKKIDGGVEIGFALEKTRIHAFINIFQQYINMTPLAAPLCGDAAAAFSPRWRRCYSSSRSTMSASYPEIFRTVRVNAASTAAIAATNSDADAATIAAATAAAQ